MVSARYKKYISNISTRVRAVAFVVAYAERDCRVAHGIVIEVEAQEIVVKEYGLFSRRILFVDSYIANINIEWQGSLNRVVVKIQTQVRERAGCAQTIIEIDDAVDAWEHASVAAFLDAYRAAAAGCSSVPQDDAAFAGLLDLFTLEKALYESCYEAANRPEWLAIPLHGIERIVGVGTDTPE